MLLDLAACPCHATRPGTPARDDASSCLCSVLDYLQKLEAAYGTCGAASFRGGVERLEAIDPTRDLQPGSARLREAIDMLRAVAFEVNDQLTQRFFTHGRTRLWASLGL